MRSKSGLPACLVLLIFMNGCEQFVDGFLVHLHNESGQTLSVATRIPGQNTRICELKPGDTYLMTIGSELELKNGDNRWVYDVDTVEGKGAVLVIKCGPSHASSPNVPTWHIRPNGRIYYVPPEGRTASGNPPTQPKGFPIAPTSVSR